jgi:uncharacterized protein
MNNILINNKEFAVHNLTLERNIPIATLERVTSVFDELEGEIEFTVMGKTDNKNRPLLNITICGKIATLCQVCLQSMTIDLDHSLSVLIFKSEEELDEALFGNESTESDGIVSDPEFDILAFIEDELIMALPIAPKHATCEISTHEEIDANNPFAILKQ